MIISKIEALRPNVLLVEKTVASCAQEYLLAKEISLVLNVKKPLLDRIARCTGALITPSVDNLSKARLGHCELFRLDRLVEDHESANQLNRKPSKTLMFFEGCPRRLGCTVFIFFLAFLYMFLFTYGVDMNVQWCLFLIMIFITGLAEGHMSGRTKEN